MPEETRYFGVDCMATLPDLITAVCKAVDAMSEKQPPIGTWYAERLEAAAETIRSKNQGGD